ncbi:MAG: site-2 protease family protein [Planctomycetales bacterium]|nr:site-2 protease family protein [Planctomycetales bacterium]
MSNSWKIARVAGIDISVHWSFILLLIYVLAATVSTGSGAAHAMQQLLFVAGAFTCVVLHELGHALAARGFGIATQGIMLLPIGGVANLERIPRNPFQELVIAIAGPLVNVLIAAVLAAVLIGISGLQTLTSSAGIVEGLLLTRLFAFNVVMILFNLLPAFPMDGGRILRALLALRWPYLWSTERAVLIGQLMAVAFGVLGLFTTPMLMLIALFVYFAGQAELDMLAVEQREALQRRKFPERWAFDANGRDRAAASESVQESEWLVGLDSQIRRAKTRARSLKVSPEIGTHVRVVLMPDDNESEQIWQFFTYDRRV